MRVFVPLTREETERLQVIARAERRRPQDQAAHLLGQILRDLTDLTPADSPRSPPTEPGQISSHCHPPILVPGGSHAPR